MVVTVDPEPSGFDRKILIYISIVKNASKKLDFYTFYSYI